MATIPSIYRLSPTQEAMLFHCLRQKEAALYVEQVDCVLDGDLDLNHFEDAWQRVVNRHESCRTAFAWRKTETPVQVVGTSVRLPIDIQDWRRFSEAEQRHQFTAYAEHERVRGFDLSKAPLMRLALLRIGIDRYRFLWTHHHLILDGWSTSPLLSDFWNIYRALCVGTEPNLSPPIPYRRYIEWLEQRDLASEERFWRRLLQGIPALSEERNRTTSVVSKSPRTGDLTRQVGYSLTQRVEALARKLHITPYICLQAAFAIMLHDRARHSDIIFGTTVSGRPPQLNGYESMVGVFINTIPVRMKIPTGVRVSEWLQTEQAVFADLLSFSTAPLSDIHRWSGLPLNTSLFDCLFVFQNYPLDSAVLDGHLKLVVSDVRPLIRTKYPLTVMVMRDSELQIHFAYDRGCFRPAQIERMANRFVLILETMTATPEAPISSLLPSNGSASSPFDDDRTGDCSSPNDQELTSSSGTRNSITEPASLLDIMLTVWKQTLQVEQFGADDHFFGSGFNSLTATLLVSRIRDTFRVPIKIADLLKAPTPRAISARVREIIDAGTQPMASPMPMPRKLLMPTSLAQRRIWFADKLNQDADAMNMALALHVEGDLVIRALSCAIDALAKRHEILRTSLIEVGGIPMQKITDVQRVPLHLLDLSALETEAAYKTNGTFLFWNTRSPFNLVQAPLMRVAVVRNSPTSHTLLLVVHHIIGDLWSFFILARDLFAIYDGAISRIVPALPVMPLQYADYAAWENELAQSGFLDQQLAWWRQNLHNLSPLRLPAKVSGTSTGIRGATCRFEISVPTAEGLRAVARENNTTLFLVLLAAFALAVRRSSGQSDFAIATNVTERTDLWAEPIVGCFVNHVLLRIQIAGDQSLEQYLEALRQTAINAYARQQTPFERVAQVLRANWKTQESLPQILFSLQETPRSECLSSQVFVTLDEADDESSRLDLALFVYQGVDGGLRGYWTYNANLYEGAFVDHFSEYFVTILNAILKGQRDTVQQLEVTADRERRRSINTRLAPRSRFGAAL